MSNWLTYSPVSGHGNGTITITADTLSELEDRVATIIASNSQYGLSDSVFIKQETTSKYITNITFDNLTWVTDVPSSGGTATKDNCSYQIIAKYSDNSTEDITNLANVSGSLDVPATTAVTRQSVGILTLTATYEGKTCNGDVNAYQEAPSLSEIFFNNLEWTIDIPASGGTATKDNCSFTIIAKYSNNIQVDVTNEATVSGSLVVPISTKLTRQVVGTLSLTAEYENLTCNGSVTAYQEAPSLSDIYFENLIWVTDVPGTGGTATKDNCSFTIIAKYSNNIQVDVTNEAEVTGSLVVEYSIIEERHSAGTLMLTAKYENLTCNGSVTAYQEANYRDYLKFTFVSGGTWIYPNSKEKIEYSINNGKWIRISSKQLSVLSGDTIRVRGTNNVYDNNTFGGTAYFNLSGNIMALIGGVNYEDLKELNYNRTFQQIFANSNVVEASELLLPATALTDYCYNSMFSGCTSLTTAPELPATTLANCCYLSMFNGCTSLKTVPSNYLPANTLVDGCYESMFEGCSSLKTAPELPATTLATNCYYWMFAGCKSLTTAPALPATTLANGCYESMFKDCASLTIAPELPATALTEDCYHTMFDGCKSLTTAPALPATTLSPFCYFGMFAGCWSLTTAPELPATTLVYSSYQDMFASCTSLNYIKCLATDISAYNCTTAWVSGVAAAGTFVKNPDMASWPTDDNGIPSGWTVTNA